MKFIAALWTCLMLGMSANLWAVQCSPVTEESFANYFGDDSERGAALRLAVGEAIDQANDKCLRYLAPHCEFQTGCKLGAVTQEPEAKVVNTTCFLDKNWTCVADSEARCAATCVTKSL